MRATSTANPAPICQPPIRKNQKKSIELFLGDIEEGLNVAFFFSGIVFISPYIIRYISVYAVCCIFLSYLVGNGRLINSRPAYTTIVFKPMCLAAPTARIEEQFFLSKNRKEKI